jgi:hypothetical protein
MPLPIFNNRIVGKGPKPQGYVKALAERPLLTQSIQDMQKRLGLSSHLTLHEDELNKISVRTLVKIDAMLKEIADANT